MKIASTTYDVSRKIESFDKFYKQLSEKVLFFLDQDVEILLFPEYFLIKILEVDEIANLATEAEKIRLLQSYVFDKMLPRLQSEFAFYKNKERCLVLGSCLFQEGGITVNRTPVIMRDKILFYDKRALTPWEDTVHPGKAALYFDFLGVKCSVLTCFDVEIPEFAVELKKEKVELILIPSATENELGFYRIQRCASARAVELCCYTVVSHLIGECSIDMISLQVGSANYFVPSQSLTNALKEKSKGHIASGKDFFIKDLDFEILKRQRLIKEETNPFLF